MERENGAAAVEQAQKIISENPFLEIAVNTSSVLVMANHLNEYVMRNIDLFGYEPYQVDTYDDLAYSFDNRLALNGNKIPEKTNIAISRSQIESLSALRAHAGGDMDLKRFEFSDAIEDINNAYHAAYKNEKSEKSIWGHLVGRITRSK